MAPSHQSAAPVITAPSSAQPTRSSQSGGIAAEYIGSKHTVRTTV